MQGYLAALTLVLLAALVAFRVWWLKRSGIRAMNFGRIDKSDFLLPPFALFYFYTICAAAFDLPAVSAQRFWRSDAVAWLGVLLCGLGVGCLLGSLISFGRSFRVGIDNEHPDKLVTTGVFAYSRNPIYVCCVAFLLGALVWTPCPAVVAGVIGHLVGFHALVLEEERVLRVRHGEAYAAYLREVPRYLPRLW